MPSIVIDPSIDEHQRAAKELHALAAGLPRLTYEFGRSDVPANGVYLLFEVGERVQIGDQKSERIVRVGTHRADGGLHRRLRRHFRADRRRSVFRLHLGGALLAREDPQHLLLTDWRDRHGDRMPEVEERVSTELRDRFSFVCVPIETMEERLAVERGLIGLLAQHPLAAPSADWLGHHALHPVVRRSGLWNTQEVDAVPMSATDVRRLATQPPPD